MSEECKHIWNNCLARIKKEIGTGQSFNTWFKPIKPYKYENNTLTIRVPSQFFYEWLESHYIHLLQHVVHQENRPPRSPILPTRPKEKNPPPPFAPPSKSLKSPLETKPCPPPSTLIPFLPSPTSSKATATKLPVQPQKVSHKTLARPLSTPL